MGIYCVPVGTVRIGPVRSGNYSRAVRVWGGVEVQSTLSFSITQERTVLVQRSITLRFSDSLNMASNVNRPPLPLTTPSGNKQVCK